MDTLFVSSGCYLLFTTERGGTTSATCLEKLEQDFSTTYRRRRLPQLGILEKFFFPSRSLLSILSALLPHTESEAKLFLWFPSNFPFVLFVQLHSKRILQRQITFYHIKIFTYFHNKEQMCLFPSTFSLGSCLVIWALIKLKKKNPSTCFPFKMKLEKKITKAMRVYYFPKWCFSFYNIMVQHPESGTVPLGTWFLTSSMKKKTCLDFLQQLL